MDHTECKQVKENDEEVPQEIHRARDYDIWQWFFLLSTEGVKDGVYDDNNEGDCEERNLSLCREDGDVGDIFDAQEPVEADDADQISGHVH